jgi:hypothetical protein
VSRQAALLLALTAIAVAGALVSFAAWWLIRRGPARDEDSEPNDDPVT